MQQDLADTIALKALGWLAGNDDLLPVFLGATGLDGAQLREAAQDPDMLGSVLDFILMDDAWITAFCESAGLGYDQPLKARQALPGGALPNWT